MRMYEILSYPRTFNHDVFPVVAHVIIPAQNLANFERLIDDQTQTRIVGHDVADDGLVVVYVACTSDAVKARVERQWQ